MAKTVRPLPGFVVLKKYELEEKHGDLVLAEDAKERPSLGKVVDVGGDLNKMPFEGGELPQEGDIIAYQNYGGQELKLDGEEYVLVPFDKLIGVIEEGDDE